MTEVSSPPEYARTTRLIGSPTLASDIVDLAAEKLEDHRLLGVQPVFGLVEDDRLRSVDDGVGDLFAPVRGQAVHEDRGPVGEAQERRTHLIAAEGLEPPFALLFLSHADPHVRVNDVRARDRGAGVRRYLEAAAEPTRRRLDSRVGLVARRARDHHRGAEQRTQEQERVARVVAVADPRQAELRRVEAALPEREIIR